MLTHFLRAASIKEPLSLTYITSGGSTSDLTTYTFSGISFGNENPTREIFFAFNWSSTTARTVSSVTIGGVTATLTTNYSAATSGCRIAFARVPTGTTGDVVVTMSAQCIRLAYGLYRVVNRTNRGQNENDSFGDGVSSQSSPLTNSSVTVPAKGFAIGVAGVNVDNTYSSNVYTIDNYNTANSSESGWQIIMSYVNTGTTANTPTQSITWASNITGVRYGYWSFNG